MYLNLFLPHATLLFLVSATAVTAYSILNFSLLHFPSLPDIVVTLALPMTRPLQLADPS